MMTQKSRVVNLYKNLLYLGKDYPLGFNYFRARLHNAFMKNKEETNPDKIEKMISQGEFVVKEIEALYKLKKYRTLKQRYYDSYQEK